MKKINLIVLPLALAMAGTVALLALMRAEAQAAPNAICAWTGPQDATPYPWSNVAYWDCGKVPGPGDTAIIDNGFQVVSIDAPVTVHTLVLFSGGSGSGIHGYHTLTVTGQMEWDGDIVGGAYLSPTGAAETVVIAPGAVMSLTHPGGDNHLLQGRIVNYGTIRHTGGKWLRNYYGVIENRPGGVYRVGGGRIEQNNIFVSPDDSGWFENVGTLAKEGDDTFTLHMGFTNSGQVSVTGGTLVVNLTSSAQMVTHTGAFTVATPGILELGSYEHRLGSPSAISGNGIFRVSNGAHASVSGAYLITGLTDLQGGGSLDLSTPAGAASVTYLNLGGNTRLHGTNDITVTEIMTLSNALVEGTSSNTNTLNIAPGATLLVNQSGGLSSRTLNNYGAIVQEAGQHLWMVNDALFNNRPTGVYTVSSGGMGWGVPWGVIGQQFNNQGRMVKEGIGEFKVWGGIAFTNSGTLDVRGGTLLFDDVFVQTAGETHLSNSSTLGRSGNASYDWILNGGMLRGTGTIQYPSTVRNNGAIVDPVGLLTISGGNYSQGNNGAVQIDIGGLTPNTQYDVLSVSGNAALDGRLILSATNGFLPASGDVFNVMTYGSRSGEFATVEHGAGLAFGPEYQSGGVAISDNPTLVEFSQKPDRRTIAPGATGGYALRVTNPTTATVEAALGHDLPIGFEWIPGSSTSNVILAQPTVITSGNAQSLRWPAVPIVPGATITVHFGVAVTSTAGAYTSTASVVVTPTTGGVRSLTLADSVDVSLPPSTGTLVTASGATTYAPAEPNGLWTITIHRSMPVSQVSVVITSTPVCALPACGPLKRFYALHAGQMFTLTHVAGTTDRYSTVIPPGQFSRYDSIALVPVFVPVTTTAQLKQPARIAAGTCERVGYGYSAYFIFDPVDGAIPCNPITGEAILIDPSGYVTDAGTGQPIQDATVTLYRVPSALPDTRTTTRECRTVDTRPGGITGTWDVLQPATANLGVFEEPGFSPAAIDPPINPQRTDEAGHYGWDVIRGCWYLKVEAPGYFTKYSAVVGVPPEVTDLNIVLDPWPRVFLPLIIR